jgi:hypothetical protein
MSYELKPIRIFPELYNIEDFLNQTHPKIDPRSPQYETYWDTQLRYCLDGKWGLDKDVRSGLGGWRWQPPDLYFYVNNCVIKDDKNDGRGEVTTPPSLRDVDWMMFYGYNVSKGFSGYSDDPTHCCNYVVGKMQQGLELTPIEAALFEAFRDFYIKKDGSFKEYIDPIDYLYRTTNEPYGTPRYDNAMKDFILLTGRGTGKSYSNAGETEHYFVTHGAKSYKDYIENGFSPKTLVVGSPIADKSSELLSHFKMMYDYLGDEVGSFSQGRFSRPGYFWHPTEGTLKPNNRKEVFANWKRSVSGDSHEGVGSKIVHVVYTVQNPEAGVGYRSPFMLVEEAGLLSNFFAVRNANHGSQFRDTKIGWTSYIGTGGNMQKIKEIQQAFLNADAYNIVGYKDLFNSGKKKTGLFIPAYYRRSAFKTEQGNTRLEEAFKQELIDRELKKEEGGSLYDLHIQYYPITLREMFLQTGTNRFPVKELQSRLFELEDGEWKKRAKIGSLEYVDPQKPNEVEWNPDVKGVLRPIVKLGQESEMKDLTGAIIIYEHPDREKIPEPTFEDSLYKVVYDPVDLEGEGTSLASVLVYKGIDSWSDESLKNTIVAEWIGRYEMLEDMHEVAFKLATYYKAKIMPEVMNEDIKRYARLTHRYHMLQPKPNLAIKGVIDQKKNYDVGIYLSPGLKPHGEKLLADTLNRVIDKKEEVTENGYRIEKVIKRNLNDLCSIRVVEELINYRRDGNFDHVSSLIVLAFWLSQEELKPVEEKKKRAEKDPDLAQYLRRLKDTKAEEAFNY